MDFDATAVLGLGLVPVFGYVQDLATYPRWFSIIDTVAPTNDETGAWWVDVGARLGPLRRTKRLRMERTFLDADDARVRFERREDRSHSPWVLDAQVTPEVQGCRLSMHLHYGGISWVPGLDLLLREEARRAGGRLERVLRASGHV